MELRVNPLRSAASDRLAPQQAELARLLHAFSAEDGKTPLPFYQPTSKQFTPESS
jgi:hypothetical protein